MGIFDFLRGPAGPAGPAGPPGPAGAPAPTDLLSVPADRTCYGRPAAGIACGIAPGPDDRRADADDPRRDQCVRVDDVYYCGDDDGERLSAILRHRG